MTLETARVLVASGFFMLLVLLRLDAPRFGTAEYEKPFRRPIDALTWLSWYAIGAVLLAAVFVLYPQPREQLYLAVGHGWEAVVFGVPLAVVGAAQAVAYARYRYGYLRLPASSAYPRAAINSIGTAIVDEAVFRGIVLGGLMTIGAPSGLSIAVATLVYLLATRLAAPGRRHYMLIPALLYGLAGGWATIQTGGLGAAFVLHAVTSFALFLCTGHGGQPAANGREPEEVAALRAAPAGWLAPGMGALIELPTGAPGEWLARPQSVPGPKPAAEDRAAASLTVVRESIGKLVHRAGHV